MESSGNKLSKKERAWASSFSQVIPDLKERSTERLAKLLAADFTERFQNSKGKKVQKKGQQGSSQPGKQNQAKSQKDK